MKNSIYTGVRFIFPALLLGTILFAAFVTEALAQSVSYGVSFESSTAAVGSEVTVLWQAPTSRPKDGAWIGLYLIGESDQQYEDWEYVPNSGTSGEVSFYINKAGVYEVRIFDSSAYTRAAVSGASLQVGTDVPPDDDEEEEEDDEEEEEPGEGTSSGSYTVTTNKSTYKSGETIEVRFTTPSPRESYNDWVGLYAVGDGDQRYKVWKSLPSDITSGTVTFTATVGTYEVRLFDSGAYTRVASSPQITVSSETAPPPENESGYELELNETELMVGETVTVSWTAPSSDNLQNDWIGVYFSTASNGSYKAYRYTDEKTSGSFSYTPNSPGTYEFRYLKNNGYTSVGKSPTFVVLDDEAEETPIACIVPSATLNTITNYPVARGNIIALGDSLTAGVGATAGRDYVSQLEDLLSITIENEGLSGDTTRDALLRLDNDVIAKDPEVVIVWLGGNDILQRYYEDVFSGAQNPGLADTLRLILLRITGKLPEPQGITETETFENITEVVTRIQDSGAVVVIVGFSGGVFDSGLENKYRAIALETGALYVPNVLGGVIGRPSLMSDLVHPNNSGYAIVAERVARYVSCTIPG